MVEPDSQPQFDSTRKALLFALNADGAYLPGAVMNRMMASIKIQTKAAKIKAEAKNRTITGDEPKSPPPGEVFRGLDKTAQAGFILSLIGKLDPAQKNALTARLTRSRAPCACRSPCCRGWRPNPRWKQAMEELAETVKSSGDVLRVPGKKGMSTDPRLRLLLIEDFLCSGEKRASLADLARLTGITEVTIARHRAWIDQYLEDLEDAAWVQIDVIFDMWGVTGAFE